MLDVKKKIVKNVIIFCVESSIILNINYLHIKNQLDDFYIDLGKNYINAFDYKGIEVEKCRY